ncbi:hypothetical protein KGY71_00055 [Candidatus Bipolaricaulota bacterium]|nr:hypothetical protein [Candidatus Bipolaricaulota bacterium]
MNKTKLLSGKHICLGVGGVSTAHESPRLARRLRAVGAEVEVVLSEEGRKFITPRTFEEITGRKVLEESKLSGQESRLEETLAGVDMVMIAPASFSFIDRLASNLEGRILNTLVSLSDQPVLIAPSMESKLYSSHNVRGDLRSLRDRGFYLVEPSWEVPEKQGLGLPLFSDSEEIISRTGEIFQEDSLLEGKKVLITAGPTREPFRSRESPGVSSRDSLGFELSQQARKLGAEVLLVSGPTDQIAPPGVGVVWTRTTEELDEILAKEIQNYDLMLMTASASDWETGEMDNLFEEEKTKRLDLDIDGTPNVLRKLGKLKENKQYLVSLEPLPKSTRIDPEEKIEENNLDACFRKTEEENTGTGDSSIYSGYLLFQSGNKEEFEVQNVSRLARSLLKEISKRTFQSGS